MQLCLQLTEFLQSGSAGRFVHVYTPFARCVLPNFPRGAFLFFSTQSILPFSLRCFPSCPLSRDYN
jgi:hypothetical protein